MNKAIVRPATNIDAEPIAVVYADAYQENRRLGFPASAESVTAAEVAGWIDRDAMWVAQVRGEVVGAVRLRVERGDPTLCRLGVITRMKGQGIGSLLIEVAETAASRRGFAGVYLSVAAEHPFLPGLYARKGYIVVGPKLPPNARYHEVIMRKDLPSLTG
jgi:predicted N-acetyltransferase YhbS